MSPNSDNAMARFLFAILKQKNLKDIDWNQVAQDPVLLHPIPNGHAARMRYSRFRATVTGHESQKRGRCSGKDRVSKSSKKDHSSKKDAMVKSESSYSPAFLPSPYPGEDDDFTARFLTPCSDDMISVHPPVVEKRWRGGSNAFSPMMDTNSDFLTDSGSLTNSPAFSAFDAAYDLSNYSGAAPDFPVQDISDLSGPQSATDCGQEWHERFHDAQLF
ncbi:uncharacterized protein MAM_01046 [Metarhizium album ARSEF 1941]|uniref:Myb-like DNA-binding domain-containing protein n=1 Tax=Metarhizium album (strain ARSEF 1941) TaxID=1081103 RepID=A0A0B2X8Z5_METAS|nr:uncharacterized protein MAM_01046 [Metarhizium album ARSEF 1941]KHO02045.1 hypothetical protein MAM_01046 [Metarhizium album ARSEF 1941]